MRSGNTVQGDYSLMLVRIEAGKLATFKYILKLFMLALFFFFPLFYG